MNRPIGCPHPRVLSLAFEGARASAVTTTDEGLMGKALNRIVSCLMALVLAGCGCTAEGCGADLRFGAEMLAGWADAEEFTLEVCVEGACETLHVGDALSSEYFAMPVGPNLTGSVDVELTVTTDAGSRTASGTIELGSYRPNGGFCPPVCQEADVSIEGETLRNAEPGEIPPRD